MSFLLQLYSYHKMSFPLQLYSYHKPYSLIYEIHFSKIDDLWMLLVSGTTFEEVIFF
ncbi:hypothetical protein HanIR_Chr01g0008901 [Helianthus annuus]|nr:hypothetical protein HanIR_Chr01g0008901 [Helianthus annuus]